MSIPCNASAPAARPVTSDVTVVIATRNRCAELRHTLAKLTSLPERPSVVVIDNGSTDRTGRAVTRHFPEVRLIALRRNHGAVARNAGVRRAKTRYVALSDDDSWWEEGSLRQAVDVLDANPRLGLVAPRILVGPQSAPDPTNEVMAASPLPRGDLPGPWVIGFLGCGTVIRRSAYLSVGGFSRLLFIGGEEQLLAYDLAAAGWPACYLPDIVARHHPSQLRQPPRRGYQFARNRVLVGWLRRPVPVAARQTARLARRAVGDLNAAHALGGAAIRLPAALAGRRILPPDIEASVRLLGH